MIAVMPAPTRTPRIRLEVSISRMDFKRSPAAISRPAHIICMPYKNRASPPKSIKMSSSCISFSPLSTACAVLFIDFYIAYNIMTKNSESFKSILDLLRIFYTLFTMRPFFLRFIGKYALI